MNADQVEIAVDTSVAVPLLVRSHPAHASVWQNIGSRRLRLTGHSLAETYAVLTRLPGGARAAAADAVKVIDDVFGSAVLLPQDRAAALHRELSALGIVGGATYDAMVGLAAREHGLTLLSRDVRALATYIRVGASTEVVTSPLG